MNAANSNNRSLNDLPFMGIAAIIVYFVQLPYVIHDAAGNVVHEP
jgi:hypothetical protein